MGTWKDNKEFQTEARAIMNSISKSLHKRRINAIEKTRKMYRLKARYFPKLSLRQIYSEDLIKTGYCPLCEIYISEYNCGNCPLGPGQCCEEWDNMYSALCKRNRKDFDYWFRRLKKRIDSL